MASETDSARYQLGGLAGFGLSGVFFIAAGVRAGDSLTVIGSVIWLLACAIWAVPVVRSAATRSAGTGDDRSAP